MASSSTTPLLVMLGAFVVTFLTTRVITRLIRSGRGIFRDNVTTTGVHVHHAVPGIVLLLAGAVTATAATTPVIRDIAAAAIGAGASLVLDEFALILHLNDVYWSTEGRASVQAVALFAACLALACLGFAPLSATEYHGGPGVYVPVLVTQAVLLWACWICARKGKYRLVLLAIFVFPVAFIGAIRLARPGSPWYRHHYPDGSTKQQRALRRAHQETQTWGTRWTRVADLIAGAPTPDTPPTSTTTESRAEQNP